MTNNNYQLKEKLYESNQTLVYTGKRLSDNLPVVLKILQGNFPSPEKIAHFQQEYEITKCLSNCNGVIQVFGLEKYQNELMIVMEDIGAISLADIISRQNLNIATFVNIAIRMSEILGEIHQRNIIHKDIKPHNIVYNTESGKLEIIDFGSASLLSRETANINMANSMEGTLAFISPEQTGRMNRMVDYRTDFYSLGVTFYRLVTGKLPFEFHDALELIHSHIAILPESPEKFWIPKAISEIILKLMSKNAEDRYMSAVGLLYDLEWCSEHKQTLDTLYFRPGLKDVSLQFQIPEKVYGREEELKQLLDSYKQVTTGSTQILLVNGMSGIGKTVLVNEIQKPIVSSKGYYITGKFDPMKRNMPFRAIIYALQDLVKLVLTE